MLYLVGAGVNCIALLNYSHTEASQAKRVKHDPAILKELFKTCWETSDSRTAFAAALWEQGYCLAPGDRRGFVAIDANGEVYAISRWCGIKAKEVRARFGNGSDLPTVDEAIALLAGRISPPDRTQTFQSQIKDHETKVAELVARQRQERVALASLQETRRIAELKAHQSQLPTGIKASWARLTGHYQQLCDKLADDAQICETRDRTKMQALIDRHLAERRGLDQELTYLEAQHAFEQEFLDKSALLRGQVYHPDPRQPLILPREYVPFTTGQLKRQPELILAHISDKQARFSRNDILRGLAAFIDDPLELRVAADRALASSELVALSDGKAGEFTTRDFRKAETHLSACSSEMANSGGFKVNAKHIERAIRHENTRLQKTVGANLSDEQVHAIHHILSPNQLSSVIGLAGAGKSTLLSVARQAWEQHGYRVHGAALAGKAADGLQTASGIQSRTLASLEASWKSGYEPVGCGDVVVIDETGMVGTRQLARVTEALQNRGCKLVLVGDPDQLQPIQAGKPFNDISNTSGAARLTEIRRQKSEWQREASRDLANGLTDRALQNYADHGAVHEGQDRDQAIATLVDDYMTDWQTHGADESRLALAHRRKDVYAINQAIKSARAAKGETVTETLFETDHGPRAFAKGDRILFTRNDAILGVRNGMLGTVKTVGERKLTVQFDPDEIGNRRKLTFTPREFTSIDHGFAVSIHRSQGCTVDRSFVLSSQTLDKSLTYVALTRHKEETGFYIAPDITLKRNIAEPELFAPKDFRARVPVRSR